MQYHSWKLQTTLLYRNHGNAKGISCSDEPLHRMRCRFSSHRIDKQAFVHFVIYSSLSSTRLKSQRNPTSIKSAHLWDCSRAHQRWRGELGRFCRYAYRFCCCPFSYCQLCRVAVNDWDPSSVTANNILALYTSVKYVEKNLEQLFSGDVLYKKSSFSSL